MKCPIKKFIKINFYIFQTYLQISSNFAKNEVDDLPKHQGLKQLQETVANPHRSINSQLPQKARRRELRKFIDTKQQEQNQFMQMKLQQEGILPDQKFRNQNLKPFNKRLVRMKNLAQFLELQVIKAICHNQISLVLLRESNLRKQFEHLKKKTYFERHNSSSNTQYQQFKQLSK